jgi:hypothetical protein
LAQEPLDKVLQAEEAHLQALLQEVVEVEQGLLEQQIQDHVLMVMEPQEELGYLL